MTMFTKMMTAGAGLAAMAAAAPAAAQYGYPQYGYPSYGAPYGNAYGYYANNPHQLAVQQCSAAVQQRLSTRQGLSGIFGSVLGVPSTSGRVLSVTQVRPRGSTVRVRGLANSGRYAYSPYGYGMYGAAGAAYQPDLSFKCDVDYRGRVRDLDIIRRR
jgi:hypothetical protein